MDKSSFSVHTGYAYDRSQYAADHYIRCDCRRLHVQLVVGRTGRLASGHCFTLDHVVHGRVHENCDRGSDNATYG